MPKVLDAYPWIAKKFEAVQEDQGGRYCNAQCPLRCHRNARLRFWVGESQALVFTCWAGCNKLEILRCVGCGWPHCWPEGRMPDFPKQEIVAKYPYQNEYRQVLYQTIRLEPGTRGRDKDFRQRRPRPLSVGGGWEWNLEGVRRVLYRLPELLESDPRQDVFICGGEKDVESLRRIGLVATTNVCGERSEWLESYTQSLRGRSVVVVDDADATGKKHGDEVCGSLLSAVGAIRRVRLPMRDSTAFLNALRANGITEANELREYFLENLKSTPRWIPTGPAGV